MNASSDADSGFEALRPVPGTLPGDFPAEVPVRPVPRLGRGIVWSDIVAEIAKDAEPGMRDAA